MICRCQRERRQEVSRERRLEGRVFYRFAFAKETTVNTTVKIPQALLTLPV